MVEGKNRLHSSWKKATNAAFEVPVICSVFTVVASMWLVGFLRFHLPNLVGHHIKSKVVSETQKGLDHHDHTKLADTFPQKWELLQH